MPGTSCEWAAAQRGLAHCRLSWRIADCLGVLQTVLAYCILSWSIADYRAHVCARACGIRVCVGGGGGRTHLQARIHCFPDKAADAGPHAVLLCQHGDGEGPLLRQALKKGEVQVEAAARGHAELVSLQAQRGTR
jgi:hypothetical protein